MTHNDLDELVVELSNNLRRDAYLFQDPNRRQFVSSDLLFVAQALIGAFTLGFITEATAKAYQLGKWSTNEISKRLAAWIAESEKPSEATRQTLETLLELAKTIQSDETEGSISDGQAALSNSLRDIGLPEFKIERISNMFVEYLDRLQ